MTKHPAPDTDVIERAATANPDSSHTGAVGSGASVGVGVGAALGLVGGVPGMLVGAVAGGIAGAIAGEAVMGAVENNAHRDEDTPQKP